MPRVPVARALVAEAMGTVRQAAHELGVPDPKNRPLEEVREIREEIRRRVQKLVAELDAKAA
jgi:protein-tyrosine-phosphatase